jgi:uncharacterized membrane protein YccC
VAGAGNSLGILVSTLVSAAILPQSASAAMRNALYQRFGVFAGWSPMACAGSQRDRFEAATCASSPRPWAWSLRSVTVFEDPHMRRRNGRLVRLNSEFMAITTRFNALHQLLERLRAVARCRSSRHRTGPETWPSCSTASAAP